MKTILFYGDSNTYGYDPRSVFDSRYPAEVRWIDRLKADESLGWRILADAINGRELPAGESGVRQVANQIRTAKELYGLDWFAVMLGTNDLAGGTAEYAAAKMDGFLRLLTGQFPWLSFLVIAPPLIGAAESADPDSRFYAGEGRRMNHMFHVLAEKYGTEYLSAADWELPMSFDEVHLSEEGHRAFAEHMKEWLREHAEE